MFKIVSREMQTSRICYFYIALPFFYAQYMLLLYSPTFTSSFILISDGLYIGKP